MEASLAIKRPESEEESRHDSLMQVNETLAAALNGQTPIDSGKAGIAILDDHLRYVEINETLARINGLSVEEHIGRTIGEVLPNIASFIEPVVRRILNTGEPELNVEIQGEVAAEPGVIRHWTLSLVPLAGDDGKPHGVGALVLDVSHKYPLPDTAPSNPQLNWVSAEQIALSGQSEANKFNNRIKVLKDVSLALSAAADVLEQARTSDVSHRLDVENGIDFNGEVRRFEINLIQRALKESGGNQKKAARLLNLKHTTLHTKIKRYGLPSHN
jgi:PAS domain S-box-containing protein